MQKVIYTKFSTERADAFAIRTDICVDENGRKSVRKYACYPEGEKHVQEMRANYLGLIDQYGNTELAINQCALLEQGIEFEYLSGDTLEQRLDQLLFANRLDEFEALMVKYLDIIRGVSQRKAFQKTEDFVELFGDVELEDEMALPISDIDMICSNVMIVDEEWTLIDYEWTYHFPIPLNYIIYRCLQNYLETNVNRKEICMQHGMFQHMLTQTQRDTFAKMEMHFIRQISGKYKNLKQIYRDTEDTLLTRDVIVSMGRQSTQLRYQIYFDYGNGWSENNSTVGYVGISTKIQSLKITIPKKAEQLRFDPSDNGGILFIDKMTDVIGWEEGITTNGMYLSKQVILFTEKDPWIIIPVNGKQEVEIAYVYVEASDELLGQFEAVLKNRDNLQAELLETVNETINQKNQIEFLEQSRQTVEQQVSNLETAIQDKEQNIKNLGDVLENKNNEISVIREESEETQKVLKETQKALEEIEQSISWKLTKPLRMIKKIFKGEE